MTSSLAVDLSRIGRESQDSSFSFAGSRVKVLASALSPPRSLLEYAGSIPPADRV
jgi:hypothetical protein